MLLQAHGDALEQQIADRVAEAVIDVFEAVEIEKQHGALTAVFLLAVQCHQQAVFEQRAVRQAGKRVVMRLIVEFGLCMFEAGDVGKHGNKVGNELVAIAHSTDGQPTGVQLAVLASVGDLALPVTFVGQLVPHCRVECAVVQTGCEQTRGMPERFAFAVAGDFGESAIDRTDVLLGVGDQYAFSGTFEHGGGLLQFFLHQMPLGNVAGDGQHAVIFANRQRTAGYFTEADLPVTAADMAGEVTDEAVAMQQIEHLFAFVEVDPDSQIQCRAIHRHGAIETGDTAESFVDLQQQAVALA
ncbi:hypothetical protein D3C72_716960 [compost metagenome]